jgi:hypothetical protein
MVLVGFFILPPMQFANCPNLLDDDRLNAYLCFVLLIDCLLRIPNLPLAVFSWVLQAVARRGGI